MVGVWFATVEDSAAHQRAMPVVPYGKFKAMAVSPLASGRLDPPDICLVYATPGQMIIFINGLHVATTSASTGASSAKPPAPTAGAARCTPASPASRSPAIAERRYGGVPDDEMLMALSPAHLRIAVEGMKALAKNGLRYPIAPYGIQNDVRAGLGASYPAKAG